MNAFTLVAASALVFSTTTLTAPGALAGVVAEMFVEPDRETPLANDAPNLTVTPARKFVPVIVTAVPPFVRPDVGVTLVMTGVTGVPTMPATSA